MQWLPLLPGTPFYYQAKKNNWLLSDNWEDYDQNYSAIVDYGDLGPEEIIKETKWANIRFYSRPKQLLRILKEIKNDLSMISNLYKIFKKEHIIWVIKKESLKMIIKKELEKSEKEKKGKH